MRLAYLRLAILLPLLACAGCMTRAERTAVSTSAATVWEAADAIARGADPAGPVAVIKANASAIVHAVGYQYPPPAAAPTTAPAPAPAPGK